MSTWILIPVLLVMVFVVALTLLQHRYRGSGIGHAENDPSFFRERTVAIIANETDDLTGVIPEEPWWKNISSLQQLELALYLAEKAMPVWKKFASLQVVSYRDASTGSFLIVESDLLQRTVADMSVYMQFHFPKGDSMKIQPYHNRFIGHVLALKDGSWTCYYPVKKLFLSLYFIFMGIVKQNSKNRNEYFISAAISAVLDCMELSKLYTPEEIASFLAAYRGSLQHG